MGAKLITQKEKYKYLELIAKGWEMGDSARAIGRDPSSFHRLRKTDPDFLEAFEAAWAEGTEKMASEARRRGLEGYDEVTINGKGDVIRSTHRWDSALLQQQLKRRSPEEYREQQQLNQPSVIIYQSITERPKVLDGEDFIDGDHGLQALPAHTQTVGADRSLEGPRV